MSRKSQVPAASPPPDSGQPPVKLPPLHRHQAEIKDDPSRFKVVVCGRQFGKTSLGVVMCIDAALKGHHVWWVAPTFPLADQGWQVIQAMAGQVPGARSEGRPVWRVRFPNGGWVQARSADNPDSLRGATLDGLVLDEAAIAKRDTWPTLRPTLTVRQGWAMFISTPKGTGNWFHELYESAAKREGWRRWRVPSVDSPFVPAGDVEQARQELSSLKFAQEYLAEFVSYSSGIFRQDWFRYYRREIVGDDPVYVLGEERIPLAACTKFHTVDLAWSKSEDADYTVISSWAQTPKSHLILLGVTRGRFEGPDIVPKMRQAYDLWGGVLVVERATRQASIIQEAVRTGLPVKEVRAEKDKVQRAQLAAARMEQSRVWFPSPRDAAWMSELEDELLGFPEAGHDDFTDTLSYAAIHGARSISGDVVWI